MSPKEFATKIATDGGEPDVYDLARAYLELKRKYYALGECEIQNTIHLETHLAEIHKRGEEIDRLESEIAKLKEQNAGLIEALRFYAEERNWTDGMNYWEEFQLTPCGDDFGKKANSALKKWGVV